MRYIITLRDAVPGDIETIFNIRTAVKENHLSREQMAEMGITPQTVLEIINASRCIWIAEVNGQAVSFAMAIIEEACLFAIFVTPEFEGLGVGKKLLQKAESFLFSTCQNIWLETASGSRAATFYKRHGWVPVSKPGESDIRFEKSRSPAQGR